MQQQGLDQAALPEKKPTSGKTAKVITGCGGCGCLFGLLATLSGALLLVWGLTDSKVDELVVPSAGILVLAVVISFFGAALLIGGIIAGRKAKKGAVGVPPPQQMQPPPPQYPPQHPGGQGPGDY